MPRPLDFGANKVGMFLNDVPIEFIGTRQWSLIRGTSPFTMEITASDNRFSELENPVELTVFTPGPIPGELKEVTFKRLYLLQQKSTFKGLRTYLLADFRWLLRSVTLTAQYNILSYGGSLRPLSARDGVNQSWTVVAAFQDSLRQLVAQLHLGDPPSVIRGTDDVRLSEDLPFNLGNSSGGGWVGAKIDEFVPAMIGDIADITMTREGDLEIVDRHTAVDVLDDAASFVLYDGDVSSKDVHWQKPRKIVPLFEKRLGGRFSVISAEEETQADVGVDVLEIENVIPMYAVRDSDIGEWLTFSEFFLDVAQYNILLNDKLIRERMMGPRLFSIRAFSAPERVRAAIIEDLVRTYWRSAWRVFDSTLRETTRRTLADIQLGKIQSDGTSGRVSVKADYVKVRRWQAFKGQTLSENVTFDDSLFEAEWIDRDRQIFYLSVGELANRQIDTAYLGNFRLPIELLDLQTMVVRGQRFTSENVAEFDRRFRLSVYYHGLYVGEISKVPGEPIDDTEFFERLLRIEQNGFPDGEVHAVEVMARGLTANYSRDAEDGEYTLLNAEEINLRAAFIASQIRQSYEQERSGILRLGGVAFIADNETIRPAGEIHSVTVTVGMNQGKEFEIVTVVDVRPEVRLPLGAPAEPLPSVRIL